MIGPWGPVTYKIDLDVLVYFFTLDVKRIKNIKISYYFRDILTFYMTILVSCTRSHRFWHILIC